MVAVLYQTIGEHWEVVQRPGSRTLSDAWDDGDENGNVGDQGNGGDQGNSGDQGSVGDNPHADDHDHPCLEDDYVDAEADLASCLGVNIVAQPVVPVPDSQIPPDTLDYYPEGDGQSQHEELSPDDPKPEPPMNTNKNADAPADVVSVADSDTQITPTELELTPEATAPMPSSTPVIDIVDSNVPDKTDTKGPEDLNSVRNRIAMLKPLDYRTEQIFLDHPICLPTSVPKDQQLNSIFPLPFRPALQAIVVAAQHPKQCTTFAWQKGSSSECSPGSTN